MKKKRSVVRVVNYSKNTVDLKKNSLRTFAPIATAHFFAHVTHSSCIVDHEGKQTWHRVKRKSRWHHGIAVDPGLLGNVTQSIRDSVNRQSL